MKNSMKRNERFSRARKVVAIAFSTVLVAALCLSLTACGGSGSSEQPSTGTSGSAESNASGSGATSGGTSGSGSATPVTLQIFAANSLEKALPEVQALYTSRNPHVTFSATQFKGSGDLVTELQGGAPADILITASASTMDNAVKNGNIDEATRLNMFKNDLIVVRQAGSKVEIKSLADVNGSAVTKVAIGDADAVPAGAYANQSLNTVGFYSDASGKGGTYLSGFEGKVVIQSSVGNVAKTVASGDCEIGFVYTSDLYRFPDIEQAFVVPADTHKSIIYPGAVVKDSKVAQEAAAFLEFCQNDPEALKIWAQYGFELAK